MLIAILILCGFIYWAVFSILCMGFYNAYSINNYPSLRRSKVYKEDLFFSSIYGLFGIISLLVILGNTGWGKHGFTLDLNR